MFKNLYLKDVFLFFLGVALVAGIVIWAQNSNFANTDANNHSAPAAYSSLVVRLA